ncbi:S-layer homology domain-containing protein [Bacillus sp. B190/17]|uniref:S-layer homology domain-containing protein n=1 Tax=Bacillus lumedeiriae TaxID=3058829 RepID=A0ABW8I7U3_9BACI
MLKRLIFLTALFVFSIFGASYAMAATEVEPNNTVQQATTIGVNQQHQGVLSSSSDDDYYKFTLNKPGNVSITMANLPNSSWYVRVYDSQGTTLNTFNTEYGSFANGNTKDQIGLPAGTYYVRISNYTGASGIPYTFNLQYEESNLYEQEANNNVQSATSMKVNNVYKGVLSSSSDDDYYKFTLDKPGNVSITMPNLTNSSWDVNVYNSQGTNLNRFYTDYGSFATGDKKDQIGLPAGTYYIRVSNYTGASKVPYHFNLQYDESSFVEKELNGSFQEANPIQLNYKYQGVLSSSGDYDYYSFKVDRTTNLVMNIPNLAGSSWDVKIYDEKGNTINRFHTDYGSFASGNTTFPFAVTKGTYYISIDNYTGASKVPYSFALLSRNFKDLGIGFWGYNELTYLYNKGVISGYPDNTFRPNHNITRAQAAIMVARALKLDTSSASGPVFTDVPKTITGYTSISAVMREGLFDEFVSTEFKPYQNITRGEMASILSKAFKLKSTGASSFKDTKNHWANGSIQALADNNITLGYLDNTFRPNESITRAHFSLFFARTMESEFKQ